MTRRFMVHVSREFANAINLNEETSYCRLRRWLIGAAQDSCWSETALRIVRDSEV